MRSLVFLLAVFLPLSALSFDPTATTEFVLSQGSEYCMGCHDGTLASAVKNSHPVGTNYLSAQLTSKGRLRHQSQLDSAIHLLNGRVVCTSCHHPDSLIQQKLTIANLESQLCFSCHNL